MSQETKERKAFHKMIQNLHHIGADNSPFVPQSPLELTAFRAEMAEVRKKRLSREVNWRMATLERKRAIANDPDDQLVEMVPLLLGAHPEDELSPMFASQNCFRKHISHDDSQWVTWPSLTELKEEGDKRSGRYDRYFPLPRLNVIVQGHAMDEEGDISWLDGTRHCGRRAVKCDTRFIRSVSPVTDVTLTQTPELKFQDLPGYLQTTLLDMEQEMDD
jgi:hypothetical protein